MMATLKIEEAFYKKKKKKARLMYGDISEF